MFWIFAIVAGLGFVMTQLGAYSVWISVMSLAVKILGLLLALSVIFIVWDKIFRTNISKKYLPIKWLKRD